MASVTSRFNFTLIYTYFLQPGLSLCSAESTFRHLISNVTVSLVLAILQAHVVVAHARSKCESLNLFMQSLEYYSALLYITYSGARMTDVPYHHRYMNRAQLYRLCGARSGSPQLCPLPFRIYTAD